MTFKLPTKKTDGFARLKVLFELNNKSIYPTEKEWHDKIGNKGVYPSHFKTWLNQIEAKGYIYVENGRYMLTRPLVKYISEMMPVVKHDNLVPPRRGNGFTAEMKGYAASIIRATGAQIRDISFHNGDTSPEKFRGI